MSDSSDFGVFTPAERRAALVQFTRDVLARGAPKTYPPNKDGQAKEVKPGSEVFAAACWAKRRVQAVENSIKDSDPTTTAAPSAQEGDGATPF